MNVSEAFVDPAIRTPTDTIATAASRKRIAVSGTVALLGMAMTIAGGFMIVARVQFAAALLGARFFFGVPMTNVDAGKVAFIGIAGFALLAIGLVTILGSLAAVAVSAFRRT
jgi:hypothetical protein